MAQRCLPAGCWHASVWGQLGPSCSLPTDTGASVLHPALFVSPKCAATWPLAVLMFRSSEIRESLNGEDKVFLVLHNQVLTFKLVTYVVDLSKCSLAFISKFSKACKAGQAIQNFLIHCNKSINTV